MGKVYKLQYLCESLVERLELLARLRLESQGYSPTEALTGSTLNAIDPRLDHVYQCASVTNNAFKLAYVREKLELLVREYR